MMFRKLDIALNPIHSPANTALEMTVEISLNKSASHVRRLRTLKQIWRPE